MTHNTLKPSQIEISKDNPRKAFDDQSIHGLAQSIKMEGLLQNLVVAKPKGKKKKHTIICGERRFRAISFLIENGDLPNDHPIPVEIKDGLSHDEILRMATMENMQRESLSPLEEAEAITMLIHDGKTLDDILSETGLSESTVKRRLVLMNLSNASKQALENGELSLSKAEVMSMASHEDQDDMLHIATGTFYDAQGLKDRLVGRRPTLAMAIFDKGLYTGRLTHDLLAEEDETYFDDVDQFYDLQKAAAEALVLEYQDKADWAELMEGYFHSWEYKQAPEGEISGVIVSLTPRGAVEVHTGLIKANANQTTAEQLKKPQATYSTPLVRYFAMHKSIALQATLLDNPRTMKELIVANKLAGFMHTAHGYLQYFRGEEYIPPALRRINEVAQNLYALFAVTEDVVSWEDFNTLFSSSEVAYEHVKSLTDSELESVLLFLHAVEFGQEFVDRLDTNADSLFNKVACDLDIDMRGFWFPDEPFLKRRNKEQLVKIIEESGNNKAISNAMAYKKGELVYAIMQRFKSAHDKQNPDEADQTTKAWLPEAMAFPAIDPDAPQANIEEYTEDKCLAEAA
ncbi:MAG TPA: ParB/RepB/Spo0J family partition protein [Micavibrio sp.]|nr:ParB/RepB/Spo0J family partition protein [Micavibrio sp.]HIL29687.1 ParB/RepB/Spo0J family partition protein [Micavibrio sp.]